MNNYLEKIKKTQRTTYQEPFHRFSETHHKTLKNQIINDNVSPYYSNELPKVPLPPLPYPYPFPQNKQKCNVCKNPNNLSPRRIRYLNLIKYLASNENLIQFNKINNINKKNIKNNNTKRYNNDLSYEEYLNQMKADKIKISESEKIKELNAIKLFNEQLKAQKLEEEAKINTVHTIKFVYPASIRGQFIDFGKDDNTPIIIKVAWGGGYITRKYNRKVFENVNRALWSPLPQFNSGLVGCLPTSSLNPPERFELINYLFNVLLTKPYENNSESGLGIKNVNIQFNPGNHLNQINNELIIKYTGIMKFSSIDLNIITLNSSHEVIKKQLKAVIL